MVTIVDGGPAYEGEETKHREKIMRNCKRLLKFQTPPAELNCLLQAVLFLQLGLAKTD